MLLNLSTFIFQNNLHVYKNIGKDNILKKKLR